MKLLPHAQRLIAEYERLQVQADELNGLQSGLIRIDRHALAAAIIKEFQRASPSIGCEPLLSDYTEFEEWIVRGRVDCGFRRCRSRKPSSSCATRRWLFCRKIIPSKTSKPFSRWWKAGWASACCRS